MTVRHGLGASNVISIEIPLGVPVSASQQPWYHSGANALGIAFFTFLALAIGTFKYLQHLENQKPLATPYVSGKINQPLLGSPVWEVHVWHQCPGVLRNGRLNVFVESDLLADDDGIDIESFSFETWEPNKANAVTFSFTLERIDIEQEIPILATLEARNAHTGQIFSSWLGYDWNKKE